MTTKPDALERSVQRCLTRLAKAWQETVRSYSDAYCTRQVKQAIGAEGKRRRLAVHTAARGYRQFGEWLYDLTWLRVRDDQVLDIPLAVECEWTPGNETLWDFQKLLVSRARHRVLVMWAPSIESADRAVRKLIRHVRRFRQTHAGDRYMFACHIGQSDEFMFKVHVTGRAA